MRPFRRPDVLTVFAALAAAVVPTSGTAIERLYSTGPYLVLQKRMTTASNAASFALLDTILIAALIWWVGALVFDARRGRRFLPTLGRCVWRTVAFAAAAYLVFLAMWGLNYRRLPLSEKLDFEDAAVSPPSANAMAATAIDELNHLYASGHDAASSIDDAVDANLTGAFAAVQRELGARRVAVPGRPKHTLGDWYFRRAAVDGMTDPIFLETLVARDLLPFERPFVVAHEWSHLAGYADESEANFVGWLVCLRAGGARAYSGWLFLYGEVIRDVVDRRGLPELDAGPRGDLRAIADRLRRNVSPRLALAGWMVYDRYLKANRVEAGAASYGQVVRLALGTRFGPEWVPRLRAR